MMPYIAFIVRSGVVELILLISIIIDNINMYWVPTLHVRNWPKDLDKKIKSPETQYHMIYSYLTKKETKIRTDCITC